jgi:predicted O-methyltransferase YrrM
MRSFGHVTPRYIVDRLIQIRSERRNPDWPWLTPAIVEILESWLKEGDRGLEWGAGRSTVWFAERVGHLTAIEDNTEWVSRVETVLRKRGLTRKVALYAAPISSNDRGPNSRYVRLAEMVTPESLDFCLVDGDLRDKCALAGIGLLKPGGLMIVDNVERYLPRMPKSRAPNARSLGDGFSSPEWEQFHAATKDWRCIWLTSGTTDTALWQKPWREPARE